jgi:hypothetical protein
MSCWGKSSSDCRCRPRPTHSRGGTGLSRNTVLQRHLLQRHLLTRAANTCCKHLLQTHSILLSAVQIPIAAATNGRGDDRSGRRRRRQGDQQQQCQQCQSTGYVLDARRRTCHRWYRQQRSTSGWKEGRGGAFDDVLPRTPPPTECPCARRYV